MTEMAEHAVRPLNDHDDLFRCSCGETFRCEAGFAKGPGAASRARVGRGRPVARRSQVGWQPGDRAAEHDPQPAEPAVARDRRVGIRVLPCRPGRRRPGSGRACYLRRRPLYRASKAAVRYMRYV